MKVLMMLYRCVKLVNEMMWLVSLDTRPREYYVFLIGGAGTEAYICKQVSGNYGVVGGGGDSSGGGGSYYGVSVLIVMLHNVFAVVVTAEVRVVYVEIVFRLDLILMHFILIIISNDPSFITIYVMLT